MSEKEFIGYEYATVETKKEYQLFYLDYYPNFGWEYEENASTGTYFNDVTLKFKRNRNIEHKLELVKLQRKFDQVMSDMKNLEKSKNAKASSISYSIGILGTAFLAIATFSYLSTNYLLCIIFGFLGFIGWILPYFCYTNILSKKEHEINQLMDHHYDEIDEICKTAASVLNESQNS